MSEDSPVDKVLAAASAWRGARIDLLMLANEKLPTLDAWNALAEAEDALSKAVVEWETAK